MKRLTRLLPLPTAWLAAACLPPAPSLPPPAPASQDWNDVPLPRAAVALPSTGIGPRWELPAASPWAAYQKQTLLSALDHQQIVDLPDVSGLDIVNDAEAAARKVATLGLPSNTMWVLDLPGAASVAFAAALSEFSPTPIAPVLTFNNWPAPNEIVPAEETLSALVSMQPRPPTADGYAVPVFLLDAWRLAYSDLEPDAQAFDNRYMLTNSDLPDAGTLMARGISQVMYVVDDLATTPTEEDDLQQIFLSYQEAGVQVVMVDLSWLRSLGEPARWNERIVGRMLFIDPARLTVCYDPRFYRRSHGGFGGVHAICGIHRALGFHRGGWVAIGGPGGG